MNRLNRSVLAGIVLFFSILAARVPAECSQVFDVPAGRTQTITITSDDSIELERLTVANTGSNPIHQVVVREATRDWTSAAAILRTILAEKQPANDREKALSIFQYIHDHLDTSPYRSRYDSFNVWKAFNCYGMGHCEFHARAVSALMELANLASVEIGVFDREEAKAAHSMTEVFYDGSWHLFDSSGGMYYLRSDNRRIAGWGDLMRNTGLLQRTRVIEFENFGLDHHQWPDKETWQYEFAHSRGRVSPVQSPDHSLTLRPGDSIEYFETDKGLFVNNVQSSAFDPKLPIGQAILRTRYPTPSGSWHSLNEVTGFKPALAGRLILGVSQTGSFAFQVRSQYPIVSASLELEFDGPRDVVEFQVRGKKLSYPPAPEAELGQWKGPLPQQVRVDMRPTFNQWSKEFAFFSYEIRVKAKTGVGQALFIRSMELATTCEVARRAIPSVARPNWLVHSTTSGASTLRVSIDTRKALPRLPAPQLAQELIEVEGDEPLNLAWVWESGETGSTDPEGTETPTFEVDLSEDPEFRWSLLPLQNLRRDWKATEWTLPRTYLPSSGMHFVRVRASQPGYRPSHWSRVGCVQYRSPADPKS